jgi:hypothetical protein
MSEITTARAKYIFTTRLDLDEEDFIVLREPTSFELKDFGDDGRQNIELLQRIFPKAIVEHSFTENGQPIKADRVASILLDSGSQFTKIIETWMASLPINEKKSGKSAK